MEVFHLYPAEFSKWFGRLSAVDRARTARRIELVKTRGIRVGLPHVRRINNVIWELRIPSGLRLYFTADSDLAVFVKYGNKGTQRRDITAATRRANELYT